MAKRNEQAQAATTNSSNGNPADPNDANVIPDVPPGYQEIADDLTGYWKPDFHKMIHVTPVEAKVFDSQIDDTKPSTLIFCKLVDSAILMAKDENGKEIKVEGKPGDMIGIWGKPGLRQKLINMAGRDCFICVSGTKDIGKQSPMTTYSVRAKGFGKPLPLTEDRRERSKRAETWWHNADGSARSAADDSEESLPNF